MRPPGLQRGSRAVLCAAHHQAQTCCPPPQAARVACTRPARHGSGAGRGGGGEVVGGGLAAQAGSVCAPCGRGRTHAQRPPPQLPPHRMQLELPELGLDLCVLFTPRDGALHPVRLALLGLRGGEGRKRGGKACFRWVGGGGDWEALGLVRGAPAVRLAAVAVAVAAGRPLCMRACMGAMPQWTPTYMVCTHRTRRGRMRHV